MRTLPIVPFILMIVGCGAPPTPNSTPTPAPLPKAAITVSVDSKSQKPESTPVEVAPLKVHPEIQRLHTVYDRFRLQTETTLPQSGFDKVAQAIASAKPDATELCVPLSEEYQVLLSRNSNLEQKDWTLCCNVLLCKKPTLDHFSTEDTARCRSLLRYYGSKWIRHHTEIAEIYSSDLLWWNSGPLKEPEGKLTFETGDAQLSGRGLHITITPAGDLVSVSLVFNPD